MTRSRISFILISVSIFFTDAAEVATSGSGKAIYSSPSRNPISTYFKEHKNKLNPYFARPASSDSSSSQISSPYSQGLSIHDDTSASVQSNYYDASSSPDSLYLAGSSTNNDDHHGSSSYIDPYDSSSLDQQASNLIYSVDPLSNGYASSGPPPQTNPGYYGGDPLHATSYNQPPPPSFHGPGLPAPSHSSSNGNAGYYGTGDPTHPTGGNYHENSVYSNSNPQGSGGSTSYYGNNGSPAPAYHHGTPLAPTSNDNNNHNNHDKNNVAFDNSDYVFPIPGGAGYGASDDEEEEPNHSYDYGTGIIPDDDMMLEFPFGGGSDPTPAPPAGTDPSTPVDNPLNFLNLVGTDFQPGRLVNIFFGLFIMLFMIISHGYALWILGIAYLPGTRSLNQWEFDKDKIDNIFNLLLDALEYWEDKVE